MRAKLSIISVSFLGGLVATHFSAPLSVIPALISNEIYQKGVQLPLSTNGYPIELPLCRLDENLQRCIDKNNSVRLAIGDYRRENTEPLILKSGQKIFGLPGTVLPRIRLSSGTEGAIISTISTAEIDFLSSTPNRPIRLNAFIRVNGLLNVLGSMVEDNIFTYCGCSIKVNTSSSGYLRNNLFIGSHPQSSSDMIIIDGDIDRQSYGNTFLWHNFLTPHGRATFIRNQKDISFIGIDAEGWNEFGEDQTWSAMLNIDTTSVVRVVAAGGGNHGKYPTPFLYLNADKVQISGIDSDIKPIGERSDEGDGSRRPVETASPDALYLGPSNRISWLADICCVGLISYPMTGLHFEVFRSGGERFTINGVGYNANLFEPDLGYLRELFAPLAHYERLPEQVGFEALPDPAGSNWKSLVAESIRQGVDDSAHIQKLIDDSPDGVALIPEGKYFLARSLVLGSNKGLIGAGRDKTVIIALSEALDMIVPGDAAHPNNGGNQRFLLSDLTLQGGRRGIFHSYSNSGSNTQLNNVFLSHVQFREMKEAGIEFKDIYGWDNNFLDFVAFVNCKYGFRQTFPTNPRPGENADNNYIDKTIFFRSQFVGNGVAVDLAAHRVDNFNAFIYSLFQANIDGAIFLRNATNTVFAGSKFIDNGGAAVVNTENARHTSMVGCYFAGGTKGRAFFSEGANVEGSRFAKGQNKNMRVFSNKDVKVVFYNTVSDVTMGEIHDGVFVNSKFPGQGLDRFLVVWTDGELRSATSDASNPKGQLLRVMP